MSFNSKLIKDIDVLYLLFYIFVVKAERYVFKNV